MKPLTAGYYFGQRRCSLVSRVLGSSSLVVLFWREGRALWSWQPRWRNIRHSVPLWVWTEITLHQKILLHVIIVRRGIKKQTKKGYLVFVTDNRRKCSEFESNMWLVSYHSSYRPVVYHMTYHFEGAGIFIFINCTVPSWASRSVSGGDCQKKFNIFIFSSLLWNNLSVSDVLVCVCMWLFSILTLFTIYCPYWPVQGLRIESSQ